ncbi:IclR family transcriptional regulator [Jeotgalibaca sp. MA1X17-3]|uniref:IclR family transcriptional regulator n=1 Tax=Jeotgalibaca sp. MA1X17-3 TaxID=2908211 RepID=UPI001F2C3CB4|nr:IclR family transcriptional regulator [Jeotgalibaca sp. MA1X17-3]UJF16145.1 IclR family transcriptional regulator [Jeotgalibaca sp. MA1X17-3]
MTQPYGTVLIKASKILDFLSTERSPQPLHMIAKETEMTNSTTSKILMTLEMIGYVEKDSEQKTYQLGNGLVKYASQYLSDLDISKIAYPYLKKLHASLDETVHLSIRKADEIMYINKIESLRPIVVTTSRIGFTKPMYASAMGKAILAEEKEEEVDRYLERTELKAYTPHTITSREVLKEELKMVREKGYAFDNSEEQIEVFCIAASLSWEDNIYGAFSVSMPAYRRTAELEEKVIHAIMEVKSEILKELAQLHFYL